MKTRNSRRSSADIAAGQEWNRRVTALGCVACPDRGEKCEGDVQGHHVLYQKFLRNWLDAHAWENDLGRREKEELERRLFWDVRNGMGLCYRAHRRHHNRAQPIPIRLLPPGALVFAAELGLVHRLERLYPADPPGRVTA